MFLDVTDSVGLNQNNNRFSFAPAWCDYNNDGWPDLFVANDFGRKNLYKNEGGHFRDVAAEAGVEDIGDGMSAAWFNYDGAGRQDFYVSNMWSDACQRIVSQKQLQPAAAWKKHAKGNSIYRNKGDGTYEETGALEGVEMGRWAWSSDGIDFANDGVPEIFIAIGMSSALLNAGQARVADGDRDGGEKLYRRVLEINPKDATAANLLGHPHASLGSFPQTVHQHSVQSIFLHPSEVKDHGLLAAGGKQIGRLSGNGHACNFATLVLIKFA